MHRVLVRLILLSILLVAAEVRAQSEPKPVAIQVGAFTERAYAEALHDRLDPRLPTYIKVLVSPDGERTYRVVVGYFHYIREAEAFIERHDFKKEYPDAWVNADPHEIFSDKNLLAREPAEKSRPKKHAGKRKNRTNRRPSAIHAGEISDFERAFSNGSYLQLGPLMGYSNLQTDDGRHGSAAYGVDLRARLGGERLALSGDYRVVSAGSPGSRGRRLRHEIKGGGVYRFGRGFSARIGAGIFIHPLITPVAGDGFALPGAGGLGASFHYRFSGSLTDPGFSIRAEYFRLLHEFTGTLDYSSGNTASIGAELPVSITESLSFDWSLEFEWLNHVGSGFRQNETSVFMGVIFR